MIKGLWKLPGGQVETGAGVGVTGERGLERGESSKTKGTERSPVETLTATQKAEVVTGSPKSQTVTGIILVPVLTLIEASTGQRERSQYTTNTHGKTKKTAKNGAKRIGGSQQIRVPSPKAQTREAIPSKMSTRRTLQTARLID